MPDSMTEPDPIQTRLKEFLLNPASYPHRPRRVKLVETHSALVFIAGPLVYKIKKAVNLGFLDFSTLEKRRFDSEREVALNSRLSKGLYLGVIPISIRDGALTFGQGNEVVDYAVKMRTLASRYFLDRLLARGAAGTREMDRIVGALAKFYTSIPTTEEIEKWGRIDHLKISTDENFQQTQEFVGNALSKAAFETIQFYTNEFYRREAGLFESRLSGRWIRDGHGDLRMEHAHLAPKTLNIFDCIEFNDRLRYVDVANDAAFLAMDLDIAGRPDLGRYFASRMAGALGDTGLPRLIDFYKCYRACVRGKVSAIQSVGPGMPASLREARLATARLHFRQALRYAVAGSEPLVLAVTGRAGSGKSALARALAGELGWPVFSSDQTRKEIAGLPLFARGDAASRATLYSSGMTRRTYDKLVTEAAGLARQGTSVILDATFGRRALRQQLRETMSGLGVALQFVEAEVDDETVRRRLHARDTRTDEVSDARLEDFEMLMSGYEPPSKTPGADLCVVGTAGSPEETLATALKCLAQARLEARSGKI